MSRLLFWEFGPAELSADTGTYGLTGSDVYANVTTAKLIPSTGSYSVTGNSAVLARHRTIAVVNGRYRLTGNRTTKVKIGHGIFTDMTSGTYELTGSDADLLAQHNLNVDSGSYEMSGGEPLFFLYLLPGEYALIADQPYYTVSGNPAVLSVSSADRVMDVATGVYLVEGDPNVTLLHGTIPEEEVILPAYWIGGWFGIDKPQIIKMMRSGQLLTDNTGFRIKCRTVDHDRFTFRNPGILEFQKIDNAYIPVNRKTRLLSYEIQFPDEDNDANVLELSNSHIPVSER